MFQSTKGSRMMLAIQRVTAPQLFRRAARILLTSAPCTLNKNEVRSC